MRSGRGSTTAQLTALVRAALTGPTGTVNDPYAKLFLRFPWRSLVPVLGRKRIASLPLLRDAMALSSGRTCFFDEQLRLALLLGSLFTRVLSEPKQFRIDPESLADLLQEAGWRLEQSVEVTELCDRYLKRVVKRRPAQHNYVAVATPC